MNSIRLGSGRSRGLGQVKAEISLNGSHGRPGGFVTSTIRDSREPLDQLWGLGRWLNDKSYGTLPDDFITVDIERDTGGIRTMRSFTGNDLNNLRDISIDAFVKRMQIWSGEYMQEFAPVGKRQ